MFFTLIVFSFAVVMIAIEYLFPRSNFPKVNGWYARSIIVNIIGLSTVFIYGTGAQAWIEEHRLFSLDHLPMPLAVLFGLLIVTFFNYWWHRLRHEFSFFWVWFHQIHHSPQRLEIMTTFYKHPLEAVVDTALTIPVVYFIAGLNVAEASIVLLLMGSIELFYHWNIKTPQWMGYIIQRPESHCIHHQEGVHNHNYADLPIWDIIFGTFKNPANFKESCGLGAENEHRLAEMLVGVDVYKTSLMKKRHE